MIPHHSSAILMCEQAAISDPEIIDLCEQIVQSQEEEIAQMKALLDTIQKRLSLLVYVSIVGLILTGMIQARQNPAFEGLLRFGSTYSTALSLKHIVVVAMVGIALVRSLALGHRERLTPSQEKLSVGLLLLNLALGVAILLLTGISAAYALPPA